MNAPRVTIKILICLLVVLISLFGYGSLQSGKSIQKVEATNQSLARVVAGYEAQVEVLKAEKERLLRDGGYFEQLGREEFGMIRPDECVFIVHTP